MLAAGVQQERTTWYDPNDLTSEKPSLEELG